MIVFRDGHWQVSTDPLDNQVDLASLGFGNRVWESHLAPVVSSMTIHPSAASSAALAPTTITGSAGLVINLDWDSSVSSAPAGFMAAIESAAQMIGSYVSNHITLNIAVGYGEIGGYTGGTSSPVASGSAEGGTLGDQYESYATVRQQLTASATSATDRSVLANLPSGNPFGSTSYDISGAQLKAFGVDAPTSTALDGEIGFATNWPSSDLIAAALHEITHAMGRNSGWGAPANGSDVTLLDLMRYSAPGVLVNDGSTATSSKLQYFSTNGGATVLADYSTSSDYGDWATNSLTTNDPNNAYVSPNSNALTSVDVQQLDAIGYTIAGASGGTVVSNALVSAAAGLQTNVQVVSFSILDSEANVQAGLTALAGDSKLTAIAFTDAGKPTMTLTSATYSADAGVISLITSGFNLDVTGSTVANAATLQSAARVTAFTIADTAGNVQAALATLAGESKLTSIKLTDAAKPSITLTSAAFAADTAVLAEIASPYNLTVTGALVSAAASLQANSNVTSFSVADTASNVIAAIPALSADSKLSTITATGATAANAGSLQADGQVGSFTLTDTAADVQTALASLLTDTKLTTITLSDSSKPTITLSSTAYAADAAVLGKIISPYNLVITGAAVTNVAGAAALQANSALAAFSVADTAANVQAGLSALLKDTKISTITLTDPTTPTLTVTSQAFSADTTLLAKIASPHHLTVTGASAAGAAALQSNATVTSFTVSDSVANVTKAIASLNADTKLSSMSITGTTGGDTLTLTGSTAAVTIDMGEDYLSYANGLNLSSLTFIYPPDVIALGSGPATINFIVTPLSGIEEIGNFQFGLDKLVMNLSGNSVSSMTATDTTVGGVHAVSIYSKNDPYDDGVVLTGVAKTVTASSVLSHLTFAHGIGTLS